MGHGVMDNKYMQLAIELAKKAGKKGDVPVGAVIVQKGKVLSKAYNQKNARNNPTCHAEMLAINKACKKVKNFRLENCEIYVTKEPCVMCLGAILSARIDRLYYGAKDKKYSNLDNIRFNHYCEYVYVENEECASMLSNFFKKRRKKAE